MDSSSLTLMHLMCAKFCHDISAPLGAVRMGLEMLQESPTDPTIPPLIYESTTSAIARLEIFRCLTGYASAHSKPTLAEIRNALTTYLDDKIQLQWELSDSNSSEGTSARLLLALCLTASDTLVKGGTLTVSPQFKILASTESSSLVIRDEVISLFNGEAILSQQSPRTIVPYFAIILANKIGGRITIDTPSPSQLTLQVLYNK